eukprot:GHUV01016523.1.p1 GENE.GHUV01016523.1~~GHUV01016523.1.p1  ORF type:complete len:273 (+),score=50.77 GHUV01016523.1:623-1441(+)
MCVHLDVSSATEQQSRQWTLRVDASVILLPSSREGEPSTQRPVRQQGRLTQLIWMQATKRPAPWCPLQSNLSLAMTMLLCTAMLRLYCCVDAVAFAVTSAAEMAVASVQRIGIQQISYSPQSLYYCTGIPRDCTTGWTLPQAVQQFVARSKQIPTAQCLPYKPDPIGLYTPQQLCQGVCAAVHPYALQGQFSSKQISSIPSAQQHIRQYGGVITRFDVYDDFRAFFANATNAKQVYRPKRSSNLAFGHAVVLVGQELMGVKVGRWRILQGCL